MLDEADERYDGWHVRHGTAVKRHEKFLLAGEVSRHVPSVRWKLNPRRAKWPDTVSTDAVDRRPYDIVWRHVAF